MTREPTAGDIKKAWNRFGRGWDFDRLPVLRIPINLIPLNELLPSRHGDRPVNHEIKFAEYRLERGDLNGKRAVRLIGSVPGTDLSVVLETKLI